MLSSFATELGKKLAERWLALLVLPGALYLAVATAARVLGHAHALDLNQLLRWINRTATSKAAGEGLGGPLVVLAAVLAGAAAAGIVAQALGTVLERAALSASWQDLPVNGVRRKVEARVAARRRDWETAAREWHRLREEAAKAAAEQRPHDPRPRRAALRSMRTIAPEYPERPTWSGDRLSGVAARLERDLGLDAAVCWPYICLVVPDSARDRLTSTRDELTRATVLGGWALLYAVLVVWWWPAVLLAGVIAVTAWRRTRAASDAWAQAMEATCRLYLREIAAQLGVDTTAAAREIGQEVTRQLEGSPPPLPGP